MDKSQGALLLIFDANLFFKLPPHTPTDCEKKLILPARIYFSPGRRRTLHTSGATVYHELGSSSPSPGAPTVQCAMIVPFWMLRPFSSLCFQTIPLPPAAFLLLLHLLLVRGPTHCFSLVFCSSRGP